MIVRVGLKFSCCVFIALLLVGCGNNKKINKRLDSLEKQLGDMRGLQAEQTTRLDAVQSNIRKLLGRIEEVEYGHEKKIGGNLASLQRDVSTLRRRIPPPAIVPVIALEADEVLASHLPPEESRILNNALVRIREGNFGEALPLLYQLRNMSVGREWEAIAEFWIAVCHEGRGDNKKALTSYHDVSTKFPGHSRLALALLRQGSVFIRLGDASMARLTFKKVIAEYPRSSEAARAKERLKDL